MQLYGQLVEHLVYSVRDPWWHERQMERSHSNRGEHQQSHQSSPPPRDRRRTRKCTERSCETRQYGIPCSKGEEKIIVNRKIEDSQIAAHSEPSFYNRPQAPTPMQVRRQ